MGYCRTVRMADEITGDKVIHIMKYILTIKIDIKII